MSAELLQEIQHLRKEIANIAAVHSPWIGMDEMQSRYGCTGKTLLAMERRKEIPERINGRWSRADVVEWELNHRKH